MKFPSKILEDTVNSLSSLPGVGKKTALRLALHLCADETGKSTKIADALHRLKSELKECRRCHMIADDHLCQICAEPHRNKRMLCIVEHIRDLMAIEDTQQFSGYYHVLGGLISPIDGVGPQDLHIESLVQRVTNEGIEELIMALSPTIEGDTTIFYISKRLAHLPVRISTIARGVAFGGELEYADELTLGRSIQSRTPYQNQNGLAQ